MPPAFRLSSLLLALCLVGTLAADPSAAEEQLPEPVVTVVEVDPPALELSGPDARFSLLIHGRTADDRLIDLTRDAQFTSQDGGVAPVTPTGLVSGTRNGTTTVTINVRGQSLNVPVTVTGADTPRQFHFENDIIPIFNKFGCNSGGCHGKAEGQNGFKLSVFGFDPEADYKALVSEGRGRRLFPAAPQRSLLLAKACGDVPHGGGIRIRKGSDDYRMLRDWIAAGLPLGAADAPHVVGLELTPGERRMTPGSRQQLRAVARYSDGRTVDVTAHARFQTNNDALAAVDEHGLVTVRDVPGEVAVMASYMGAVDVFRVLVPRPRSDQRFPAPPVYNFVDELVDAKLRQLNIAPSELCSDAEFLRRVSLDITGMLPTADAARQFLADAAPDKRQRLVDDLLQRPEYADYWALKWSDLLRVDREALGHKAAYSYYRWIRDSFAANRPFDQFAGDVVAAEGLLKNAPAGYLHKVVKEPGKAAATISQVFLGVRIECAQCHHHPFDRWSQADYYGMQAHFTQVGFKTAGAGEMIAALKESPTKHPRTGDEVFAYPLGTTMPEQSPSGDRRRALAAWMTSPENAWFARSTVNRYWAHFLGRGIVEPVDDFRSTNPPSNPQLLDALAHRFVDQQFDVHDLIRTITASRTYQLSSRPNETNADDEQNYSRALFRSLDAEVLFDAVCQVTGVPEKFDGVPAGMRAVQLWDSQVPHYFLKLFGRPVRATPCECERSVEPSVGQVLHILNSPEIQAKLAHAGGRLAALVEQETDDRRLVENLYLTFYSRYPDEEERNAAVGYLQRKASQRRQAAEDLAWSMLNSVEFLFNH